MRCIDNIHSGSLGWKYNYKVIRIFGLLGKPPKKKVKKLHNKCELRGGGQQILVCEPQKSAFLELIFQKKHAVINS